MRKQINVNILGIDLKLSERSEQEVFNLTEFTLSLGEMNGIKGMKVATLLLYQSISFWIDGKNFIARWFYHRKLSVKKIAKALSPREITDLVEKVMELDGNKIKKKVRENQ